MNTLEGRAWLALAGIKGMGPKAMWQVADYLFSQQKPASWLLRNPAKVRDALGGRGGIVLPDPDLSEYEGEVTAEEQEVTVLHPLHPQFPMRIKELKSRLPLPAILYAAGNLSLLKRPSVAIVGRRDAGKEALVAAEKLAGQLAERGIHVTSGYASGIDGAAHRAALQSGGTTTLVLAEGLDHFQVRPEFKGLLTDENTLVLSQFSPRDAWTAYQAMARNKLVAALAGALVVVVSGAERDASGRMSGTFDAGMSALKLGLPMLVADPSFFPSPPPGNQGLIQKGGVAWSPSAGIAPILEAMEAAARKKIPEQKKLF